VARIGKMYKLVKLTRLLRIAKFVKNSSSFAKYMQRIFNIGIGIQRLVGFICSFFILIHIVSCLWIVTAQFSDDAKGTWMEGEIFLMNTGEKYLTSIYFTVTTITTVGYGDVSINTKTEKIFCIITMLVGVISFSFASGSLSSIL
jgi:voltage-gated potassium channel Kch